MIVEKFDGGPVGLSTLAVAVGEEQDTIEDVYEPYLLQRGLLKRTPRGRVATPRPTSTSASSRQSAERRGGALAFSKARRRRPTLRFQRQAIRPKIDFSSRLTRCPSSSAPIAEPSELPGPYGRVLRQAARLREVRVRLYVRAARRLLPGARTPRSSYATQRLASSAAAAAASSSPASRTRRPSAARSGRCSGCKFADGEDPIAHVPRVGRAGAGTYRAGWRPRGTSRRRRRRTCSRPTTRTAGCSSC